MAAALGRRPQPTVLVIDEFHPGVNSVVVRAIEYLLTLARQRLRLVFISRRGLPLPLHRYRLTDEVTEIAAADLAFSEREIDQAMVRHGVLLRRESIRLLWERTEGWAAGGRLVALVLQRQLASEEHPVPDENVERATVENQAIADYLVEDVLDVQRSIVRLLLLTTSILDRINAEIATELTPGACGIEFSEIVRQNAFIIPLGSGWYRYHGMFREVLPARLRHALPGRSAGLHAAAAWFSAHGLLTEAVRHSVAAGQWRAACSLVVWQLAVADLTCAARQSGQLRAALCTMPAAVAGADLEPALVAAALELGGGNTDAAGGALRSCAS